MQSNYLIFFKQNLYLRFILRNHIVQNAIEQAEKNDFREAKALLKLMENPYSQESVENLLSDFYKDQCK